MILYQSEFKEKPRSEEYNITVTWNFQVKNTLTHQHQR